jgi:hypothetical protein
LNLRNNIETSTSSNPFKLMRAPPRNLLRHHQVPNSPGKVLTPI